MRMPLLLPGVPLGLRMQLPFMALLGVYESPLCVLLKILMQLLFVSPRGAARVADGGQDPLCVLMTMMTVLFVAVTGCGQGPTVCDVVHGIAGGVRGLALPTV